MSKLEKLVLIREDRETGISPDLGKMILHFQRCGFPLRKPPADYLIHDRHDGDVKISIIAHPTYGMPFGADVLTLLWCFATALDHKSRTIRFHAAADILKDMNLAPAGTNYRAVVNSFKRIYGASYFFEWAEIIPGKGKRIRSCKRSLFDSLTLWFHEDADQMPLQGKGFENEIVLSDFAWNWLRRTSWIETAPAYALRQVPGAIQLYFVIAGRGPRLKGPGDFTEIPLTGPDGLDKQIGGATYENQRRWRQLLNKWLKEIKTAWPDCPAQLVDLTGCTRYGRPKQGWYLQIGYFPQPPR